MQNMLSVNICNFEFDKHWLVLTMPPYLTQKAKVYMSQNSNKEYWKLNIRYLVILLSIWFFVSFGCGILFVEQLNQLSFRLGGYKLGFWFGQQGSIISFVILIAIYVKLMNDLDKKFEVEE